jgi:D-alanyl-lipoteichoic acid acyltransferase DltB (MBOAT superfamily)
MVACGLWHGIGWNFAIWGALQGIGLVFVGVFARDLGRRLPAPLVRWWRTSPVAYAASALLTFSAFAISGVFLFLDFDSALRTLRALVGA